MTMVVYVAVTVIDINAETTTGQTTCTQGGIEGFIAVHCRSVSLATQLDAIVTSIYDHTVNLS